MKGNENKVKGLIPRSSRAATVARSKIDLKTFQGTNSRRKESVLAAFSRHVGGRDIVHCQAADQIRTAAEGKVRRRECWSAYPKSAKSCTRIKVVGH